MKRLSKQILSSILTATFFGGFAMAQKPAPQPVTNVLLVHGAFADSNSWHKVIPLLAASSRSLAEQVLSWSGLPVLEVRPTAFMEGLLLQTAKTVSMQDKIMAPFGRGKNSAIAAADVARVIAEILSEPADHIGQTYHLTGPVSQDMGAVAREFSAALGRTISYVNVPLEVMKGQLAASECRRMSLRTWRPWRGYIRTTGTIGSAMMSKG
jgi:pimeloyl-ACP methyl ester carboxylesterase